MLTGSQQYEILARLASGGMAEVFLARWRGAQGFEKLLVIKKILPDLIHQADIVDMFVDEARIAGQLDHTNVIHVFDLGTSAGDPYIAMEYLFGESLSSVLKALRKNCDWLPTEIAAGIVLQAAEGLDFAHRARDQAGRSLGIVHRDVSPQNLVVLYHGGVKVVDFGIAKSAERLSKTRTGILKGKLAYMAPEQIQGRAEARSDVFALGVVLWECLTGCRLFKGDSEYDIMKAVMEKPIASPREISPTVPEQLSATTMRALEKRPGDRFQSAGELRSALADYLRLTGRTGDSQAIGEFMRSKLAEKMISKRTVIEEARQGSDSELMLIDNAFHPFLETASGGWDSNPSMNGSEMVFTWDEDGEDAPLELDLDRAAQFKPEPAAEPATALTAPCTPDAMAEQTAAPEPAYPEPPIEAPQAAGEPLGRALGEFVASWFSPAGGTFLVCLGVALYFLRLPFLRATSPVAAIGTAMAMILLAGALLRVARLSSDGENRMPGLSAFGALGDVVVSGGVFLAATAIVWVPTLAVAVNVGPSDSVPQTLQLILLTPAVWLREPLMVLMFLVALWYVPAVVITMVTQEDLAQALNPLKVLDTTGRDARAYVTCLAMLAAIFLAQIGVKAACAAILASVGPRSFLSLYVLSVLFEVVQLALPMTAAFLVGRLQPRSGRALVTG